MKVKNLILKELYAELKAARKGKLGMKFEELSPSLQEKLQEHVIPTYTQMVKEEISLLGLQVYCMPVEEAVKLAEKCLTPSMAGFPAMYTELQHFIVMWGDSKLKAGGLNSIMIRDVINFLSTFQKPI
jgi:hypothetical protein